MNRIARIVLVAALAPLAATAWAGDDMPMKKDHVRAMDKDGDGRLSRAEVAGNERLTEKFDYIDRNGDGYLGDVELRAQHRANKEGGMKAMTEAEYHEADTDKDGKLSPQEAAKFPQLSKRFGQADKNSDGFVDKDESRDFRESAENQKQ